MKLRKVVLLLSVLAQLIAAIAQLIGAVRAGP